MAGMRIRKPFTSFKKLFCSRDTEVLKICKLAKWWRHTPYQILIKHMNVRYLSEFVSEMFDYWQERSRGCALQNKIFNYVTVATYWVPDLLNVKGFSPFFWHSIWIFFSDTLFARPSKNINVSGGLLGLF